MAEANRAAAQSVRLPVLIIPGFMSSGLKVESSNVRQSWEGARVWLSLVKLGLAGKVGAGNTEFKSSDEEDVIIQVRNDWLTHMCLAPDLLSERAGIRVRALDGLKGVDFLEGNPMAKAQTYVFGPLISALKSRGNYVEGQDLCAAPYDCTCLSVASTLRC